MVDPRLDRSGGGNSALRAPWHHPSPGLTVWAFLVLGLLVRAFAGALLGAQQPPAVSVSAHVIDINRAGVPELMVLPGIGRQRAEALVVERIRRGPFRDLADLCRVDGFGPKVVAACRGMVAFSR